MRVTAYAYPWDLSRLGPERVLGDLADRGIAGIDLAATYHPIDSLSPRGGPMRLFSSPLGAVHFPARVDRYARIQPSFAPDPAIRSTWPVVANAKSSAGLALNAWTVVLFQPWIADAYPDCARVLPSGDPVGSGVCPASEDVRDYLAILCGDILDQYDIDTLRLEGIMPTAYDYGWGRPRVLVDISPLAHQLLSVCFCASCLRRGRATGIDVDRVRQTINAAIAEEIEETSTARAAERTAILTADPELHEFVVQHERAATELVRAAVSLVDKPRQPRVSTVIWTPYSMLLGDAQRPLLVELIAELDQVLIFPLGDEAHARLLAEIAASSSSPVGLSTFIVPVRLGLVPSLASPPGNETARVEAELRAASAFPIEEVNSDNYGLIRDRDVRGLMAAITAAFA
jgi:hypothetical protein